MDYNKTIVDFKNTLEDHMGSTRLFFSQRALEQITHIMGWNDVESRQALGRALACLYTAQVVGGLVQLPSRGGMTIVVVDTRDGIVLAVSGKTVDNRLVVKSVVEVPA